MTRRGLPRETIKKLAGWKSDSMFHRYAVTDTPLMREQMIRGSQVEAEEAKVVRIA